MVVNQTIFARGLFRYNANGTDFHNRKRLLLEGTFYFVQSDFFAGFACTMFGRSLQDLRFEALNVDLIDCLIGVCSSSDCGNCICCMKSWI